MPLYEYQCQECQHQLEVLQSMTDAPLTDCPACNKPSLQKVVSAAGFRLKGGGWYETDFKSGNKKNIVGSSDSSPKTANKAAASTPSSSASSSTSTSTK
jgi:putative FmdB family regulatory protein